MSLIYSRHQLKRNLSTLLRILPTDAIEWLGQFSSSHPLVRHLSRLGIRDRDVTIRSGLGQGLRFNAGCSNPDYALGINELPIQSALADVLKPGDTFYDIGAHVGFFTTIAARLVGSSGHIFAFEPSSENLRTLQRNLQLNALSNVTVIPKAVSCQSGTEKLWLAECPGGHTLATIGQPPDVKGSITVETVTIDDLITAGLILPPQLVKIDVEGAELDVLQGMTHTIQAWKPTILYEVDDAVQASFQRKYLALKALITSFDYTVVPLHDAYPGSGWHVGHAIAHPCSSPSSPNPDNPDNTLLNLTHLESAL
jgi:FkbM family methyltransferase